MKAIYYLSAGVIIIGGLWLTQSKPNQSKSLSHDQSHKTDLTGKSSDPDSPQKVGDPPREVSIDDPPPKLYINQQKIVSPPPESVSARREIRPKGPLARATSGELNPDAIAYYRKAGLFGAPRTAVAALEGINPGQWKPIAGSGGLGFQEQGGELSLTFEANESGAINGAVVEIKGGGGGARLMAVEMLMTGMEKPWDLYWEQQRPGPIAGQIKTRDQHEVHYYCDMRAMDPSGALTEPERCHFSLDTPTPEELAYRKLPDAQPLMRAQSRSVDPQ